MAAATRPGYDASPLRQRLAALRRRLYFVTTIRGVGWLLTVLVATTVVAGVLDWRWHLPGLVRAVFLAGALAGAAIIALRYLFKPLTARSDDLALALRVEERYPALNDALASTVQFLNQPSEVDHESASLRREAVRRTMRLLTGLDFNRVVDSRGLISASLSMAAVGAIALVLLWIDPVMAKTALVRFANPFGGRDWPHQTQLDGLESRYRNTSSPVFSDWQSLTGSNGAPVTVHVGRGYEFQIQGTVRGRVVPGEVEVVLLSGGLESSRNTCKVVLDEETKTHRFSLDRKPDQVQHDFSFYVRANDDTSKTFDVKVLPPPVLVPLDGLPSPQLRLSYPRYTELPSPHALPPGIGNVEGVLGTGVTLRAKADRPLRAAWIEFVPDNPNVILGACLAPFGAAHSFDSAALTIGGLTVMAPVPATLDSDSSQFTVEFLPRVHGNYVLHFEDDTGLAGFRRFELRLQNDPAPVVQLDRPSAARDILNVLPDADLPLHVLADDPVFALRSVFVYYRTERTEEPRTLPLYDQAAFAHRSLAPLTGPGVLAMTKWKLRPTNLEFRQTLSLRTIRHPNGFSLHEGDVVILQAAADDFDDVTFNKQPGVSHEIEIHIVGRNALEIELNREQAKVQQELLRLREKEREALKLVTEVENKLKKGEKLTEDDLAKLLQAEQDQQQLHERIGDDKEGLRAEIARLLRTLQQNQLQNSAVQDRMSDVQRELDRLAEKELDPIEQRLAQARQQAELDDKTRAESKAALEKKARELTDKANAAAKDADRKAAEAFKDETLADRLPQGDAEKDRLGAEAEKLKKEAAELQAKAEQLKRQAERARKDAASEGSSQPREQLDQARQHQEEVEKTLNDLLTRLEPWSSTREVKGEANKLLEEQRQLNAELEELTKKEKDLLGKPRDELTDKQKVELDELHDAQQRLQDRMQQLLEKMDRLGKERAQKDPDGAKELQDARNQAAKDDVVGQMKQAKENVQQNRIQEAQKNQQGAVKGLQKMVKTLEDRREAELDRLVKKMRETQKELDDLAVDQEQLQKKVKEAQNIADPQKREEALKKLEVEQKALQKRTQDLVKELSRMRSERASSALSKAGGEMEQAGGNLSRGQKADEKQDDALDRIDEAQRELDQARKQAEDQLRREQLGRVEETIKRLRDRQEAMNVEATRLQKEIQQRAKWPRSLGDFTRLTENEKGLAGELAEVAKKELASTPVFAKVVEKAAKKMEEAGARVEALKLEKPAFNKLPDEELQALQQDALRRLDQLLDAVKSEVAALQKNGSSGVAGGGGGDGGGSGGDEAGAQGLPPLAQLKLLRAMQDDVNKRTAAFTKAHPDLDKLTEKEKTELAGIRADQHDIEVLLEELRKANEPAGNEGDKKMIPRLRVFLLAAGVLFAGLSFAQEPPAQPDDPPVRLKKKAKPGADKPDPDKPDPAKTPMKDDKKTPPKKEDGKAEPEPDQPQEDEAEVLNRVAKNVRMAEEKIANKELGDNTRQLQEDILKDLDSLIQSAENPPQGGGAGGGEENKQDQPNDPKSNMSKSGSMGKQSGKQGGSSAPGNRSKRAQRRHRQGNGTRQANKGGKSNGSGQPMPMPGMGNGNQGNQQANAKKGGKNGGGGAKGMDAPKNNADLYKEAWGHLPPALRAEMMAYSNDKQFMAKYDELIKRYYRSIAEEGRKKEGN